MRGRTTRGQLRVVGVMLVLAATACAGSDGATEEDPKIAVVATTTVLGDVVANVAGEHATVEVLLPIGADPHDYQASAQQVAAIESADMVVANGLGLEEGLGDVLEAAAGDGANVYEVAPLLEPLPFGDGSTLDPHVWLDPVRMAEAARLIATELATIDGAVDWDASASAYSERLLASDADIEATLAVIPAERRKLVTNHDALGYFADRYGFTVVGVVIPGGSTLAEPSPAELAALVNTIESERVPAIFTELGETSALAGALAAESAGDVAVVELQVGSLGEEGTEAETLIGMLVENARLIADALG